MSEFRDWVEQNLESLEDEFCMENEKEFNEFCHRKGEEADDRAFDMELESGMERRKNENK